MFWSAKITPVRISNLRVAFGKSLALALGKRLRAFHPKIHRRPVRAENRRRLADLFDAYRQKIYGAVKTQDFTNFTDITAAVSFPEGHKHGTAVCVPREILDGLMKSSDSNSKTNL